MQLKEWLANTVNKIKSDPDFLQTSARKFALKSLLRPIEKMGISPNQITAINFLFINLPAVYFFSRGNYKFNLLALVFCLFSGLVDYIDGTVARKRGITSGIGEWLDTTLDLIWQIMLLCGISFGVFIAQGQDLIWLATGFLAISGIVTVNYISMEFQERLNLNFYKDSTALNSVFATGKLDSEDYFYANILAPGKFIFVFLFTIRYLIVLGALFNLLHYALLVIALASAVKSAVLFYIYFLYFRFEEGGSVKHKNLILLLDGYILKKRALAKENK